MMQLAFSRFPAGGKGPALFSEWYNALLCQQSFTDDIELAFK